MCIMHWLSLIVVIYAGFIDSNTWTPIANVLVDGLDGLSLADFSPETRAVSSKPVPDKVEKCSPLVVPIHQSATYTMKHVKDFEDIMLEVGHYIVTFHRCFLQE